MKKLVALLATTLALAACSTVTGPEEHDAETAAAKAKRSLEAASGESGPSLKLAAN